MVFSLRCRCGALLFLLLTLTGCANLPLRFGSNSEVGTTTPGLPILIPATTQAEETTIPSTPGVTLTPATVEPGTSTQAPVSLIRIWLPPEFDPEADSLAGHLLKGRLEQFAAVHPEIKLEVRIKELNGAGGLLESLAAASVSAPLTLPDLLLLPRAQLESAALKGLLTPMDGLTSVLDEPVWFDYARQLAHLEASMYGIPFAGDALILAAKPSLTGEVPHTLDALVALGGVMLFPAADPHARLSLAFYLNGGGRLQDAQGRPFIDEDILFKVLDFEKRASLAGVMPNWITQYSDDSQVWEAYGSNEYPMAVTWASMYLKNQQNTPGDLAISPLPSWDGSPFTLAEGWSWSLAGRDPDRNRMSLLLAEFMVEKEFMAAWTLAAGYLPPRVDAVQNLSDPVLRQAVEQISYAAQLVPPADLASSIEPHLAQAVVAVLKAESEPQAAAQLVTYRVNQP